MTFTTARTRQDIKIHGHTGPYDGGRIDINSLLTEAETLSLDDRYLYLAGKPAGQTLMQLGSEVALHVRLSAASGFAYGLQFTSPNTTRAPAIGIRNSGNSSSFLLSDTKFLLTDDTTYGVGSSNTMAFIWGRAKGFSTTTLLSCEYGEQDGLPVSVPFRVRSNSVHMAGVSSSYPINFYRTTLQPQVALFTNVSGIGYETQDILRMSIAAGHLGAFIQASQSGASRPRFYVDGNGNTTITGLLNIYGSTSGTLTHSVPAAVTTYGLEWPAATANGYLKNTAGVLSFDPAPGSLTVHTLLDGSGHSDTVLQTPTRGSLVVGNATPKWDELPLGTSGKFLRSDGTDLLYALLVAGDIPDLSATYSPVAHTHTFASLTAKPTTLAGYGITDAQGLDADLTAIAALATTAYGRGFLDRADAAAGRTYLGLGTMASEAAVDYVTIATAQDITGTKTFIPTGAGTGGLIVRQGNAQASGDKFFVLQSLGGSERGYFTANWNASARSALALSHDLILGTPAAASFGALRLWGAAGGLFSIRPNTTGAGALTDIVIPHINRTGFMVTSTNELSAIGTIAVVGAGTTVPVTAAEQIAVVNLTGQTANIAGPVALTNTAPAGFYLLTAYMECVVAGSGTPQVRITYTDSVGAKTNVPLVSTSMASTASFNMAARTIYLASGNITWNVTLYTSGTYTVRMRVAYLGA